MVDVVEVELVLDDEVVGLVAVVDLLPQPTANNDSPNSAATIAWFLCVDMP